MTIEQTIEIPADRRVYFDLPRYIPAGVAKFELVITPIHAPNDGKPIEDELEKEAAAKTAKRTADKRKPFEGLRGALQNKGVFAGDPVEIIRQMRDEW